MKLNQLKQFENKKICIFLKHSNLRYTNLFLKIEGDLAKFFDTKEKEWIYLEPESILSITIRKSEVEG